jgi:hypothetical protein
MIYAKMKNEDQPQKTQREDHRGHREYLNLDSLLPPLCVLRAPSVVKSSSSSLEAALAIELQWFAA